MTMEVLVLMSGGVDSTACAHYFLQRGDHVSGIFVDYGQLAAAAERASVQNVASYFNVPLSIVTFNCQQRFGSGLIVGRNAFLVFAAMMGSQLEAGALALGVHSGTSYYDCGTDFVDRVSHIVDSYSSGRLALICPFLEQDKLFVLRYARDAKIPLQLTYSCELGTTPACGRCRSCGDRNGI